MNYKRISTLLKSTPTFKNTNLKMVRSEYRGIGSFRRKCNIHRLFIHSFRVSYFTLQVDIIGYNLWSRLYIFKQNHVIIRRGIERPY